MPSIQEETAAVRFRRAWLVTPARNLAPLSQESVIAAFKALYPPGTFKGFKFPFIEDLLAQHPFSTYREWRKQTGRDMEGPWGPTRVPKGARFAMRTALGQQQGAFNQKAALPQLVSFQLDKDTHYRDAVRVGGNPTPLESQPCPDEDVEYAARAWQSGEKAPLAPFEA